MAVYVDNMRARFGRMIMCHMAADTIYELHQMADKIGVARRWFQEPPKASAPHYDIALTKRVAAIENGAIEITLRQMPLYTSKLMIEWCEANAPESVERETAKYDWLLGKLGGSVP